MKRKVYLETTIASYLTAQPNRDLVIAAHQELTLEWWADHPSRPRSGRRCGPNGTMQFRS